MAYKTNNCPSLRVTEETGRGARIDTAHESSARYQEFGSQSSQANDLKIDASCFLVRRLTLLGWGNDWLGQCQDNLAGWDIRSWCWQSGLPVGLPNNIVISAHCHKMAPILIIP